MRIKVMPDYQCSPLWWDDEPGRIGNIDPLELGLSPDLQAALWDWAARFDAMLNWDDPAASEPMPPEQWQSFVDAGAALAEQVRAALGEGWSVRYLPPGA